MTLTEESAIIDANHAVFIQQKAEIDLLRILLRMARGEWVGHLDKWKIGGIIKRHSHISHYVDGIKITTGGVLKPKESNVSKI